MESTKILAREEGLVVLLLALSLVEGDLTDRLGGAVSSSVIDDTSRSLRSSTSILYYNISNPYI